MFLVKILSLRFCLGTFRDSELTPHVYNQILTTLKLTTSKKYNTTPSLDSGCSILWMYLFVVTCCPHFWLSPLVVTFDGGSSTFGRPFFYVTFDCYFWLSLSVVIILVPFRRHFYVTFVCHFSTSLLCVTFGKTPSIQAGGVSCKLGSYTKCLVIYSVVCFGGCTCG